MSIPASIRDRLKKKKAANEDDDDITSKFKKRKKETLKKTYEDKDKRSSMFAESQGVFNKELMEELGIEEFKINTKQDGVYFGEILPCSFDPDCPYFLEGSVHYKVGMDNKQFICMQRLMGKPCYRCKKQKMLYNIHKSTTDEIKALFPSDRVFYLWWDRTDELANEKPQTYNIKIWSAPKKGAHSEIQSKVRNKLTKEIIDISDINEDGEGKTVYFEIAIKETEDGDNIPTYGAFDLVDREEPIPKKILKKLDIIITELESRMTKEMTSPLHALLYLPTYEEIQEAMEDEIHDEEPEEKSKDKGKSKKEKLKKLQKESEKEEEEPEDKVDLEQLEEELNDMSKLQILRWMKENGLKKFADIDLDKEELVQKVISLYSDDEEF
jgi:hypothetical protein